MNYKLLSVSHDAKTVKGEKKGYLTGILYMAPHTLAGGKTLCPFSTEICRSVCLYTAGRGAFTNVQQARIRKAKEFQSDYKTFIKALHKDITGLISEAKKKGMIPAVRLNGTTDVKWENYGIIQQFPDIQFYDYTKWPPNLREVLPKNYHLTFSHSEHKCSEKWGEEWFKRGVNTTVVFRQELPASYKNKTVINGDESDLRFTDPVGVYVGLKAKGKARAKDAGKGFVL